MRGFVKQKKYQLAAVLAALASNGAAHAQAAAESQESIDYNKKSEGLDEHEPNVIVVTANRREQTLQDVPFSITAFDQADIERQGFDSFQDFAATVPGLTLNQGVKNRGVFNIRGLALNVSGGNTQDPVSVYINETPVTDTYGAVVTPDLRLFDVERIEVLRGPQGTLFGSGSLGGTVRIITNSPDSKKFEAAAKVDLGVTKGGALRQRYDGMVNIPLQEDTLALRAVGYFRDEEGWVENINLGTKNSTVDWGGRLSLLWTPSADFSLKAEVIHQDSNPEDAENWDPSLGQFQRSTTLAEGRKAVLTNYSLTADYDFQNFATLTSVTTYQETGSNTLSDFGDLFGLGLPMHSVSEPWNTEFVIQELRLVSNTESRIDWVAGLFFIDRKAEVDFLLEVPGINDLFGGAIGGDAFFESAIQTKSQEIAAYGDVTYEVLPNLKLNGGLRVFRSRSSYSEPNRRVLNFATLDYDEQAIENKGSGTDYTWKAGLSYDIGDSLLYGSVSRGFRVGQVNPNSGPSLIDPTDIDIPPVYGPDSTINYEIGAKTAWFDNKLIANLALYYIDWKDIQIDGARVSDRRSYIANAGTARSKGVEFDFVARPTNDLTFYSTFTFQDAKILTVPTNIILPAAPGDKLPGLVGFKYSGGIQYEWAVGSDDHMYARIDGQYVGSSPNSLASSPFFARNDSYENIDAALGYLTSWGEVTAYVENLTNNNSFILDNGGASRNSVNTLRPRTIGVRLTVRM